MARSHSALQDLVNDAARNCIDAMDDATLPAPVAPQLSLEQHQKLQDFAEGKESK